MKTGSDATLMSSLLSREAKEPYHWAAWASFSIELCVCSCLVGPVRTSPPALKSVPPPQRQINITATRRNPPVTRNGGDAELVELNQQVLTHFISSEK